MSEIAQMLDETVNKLLSRHLDSTARSTIPSDDILVAARDAGIHMTLAPEDHGGLGASLMEASVIAWRWGYHAAPLPLTEILLTGALAATTDSSGLDKNFSLASDCAATFSGGKVAPSGPSGKVDAPVCQGAPSILVLVTDDSNRTAIVALDNTSAETFHVLSGEPWLRMTAENASVISVHPVAGFAPSAIAACGALLTSASIVGAAARVLEIVIEHASTRTQFGRPLAKFQAIQHRIAEAASEQIVAQAALTGAIEAYDYGDTRPLLWHAAKAQAAHTAGTVAAASHQVMGAIGFTEEHILHHYTKRLWAWRDEWTRENACYVAVGQAAAAAPNGLWRHIVDEA